jgi:NADH-quinone oxidoreductase subunit H
MFFLAEYVNMVTVSCMATTLFLGGWRMSWPVTAFWPGANEGWWPVLWFLGKMFVFLFVFVWLRGTLPRLRYDQFMRIGWKFLVPSSLLWILMIFAIRTWRQTGGSDGVVTAVAIGIIVVAALTFAFLVPDQRSKEPAEVEPASDFPTPPLDLKVPAQPRHRLRAAPASQSGPLGQLAPTGARAPADGSADTGSTDDA